MILGIGCDLIELDRFEKALRRSGTRLLERLFTAKEIAYCSQFNDSTPRFAGRFAGKEALFKALGTGVGKGIRWHDVEILNDTLGKPIAQWNESITKSFAIRTTHLSISHSQGIALAYALIET